MEYHRDKDYVSFESTFRNIFRKRLNLIRPHVAKAMRGRVLDIGCSNGIFLDLFKERDWETWGVEPSSNALEARKKGHKIIQESFEHANLPIKYFDLVILNHTLEHLDKPLEVLKKIKIILRPKGIVYIDVPNAGSLSAKILGEHWPYRLPNEHKWQFTKKSLTEILTNAGFNVVRWQSRSGILEYAHPFQELYRKRFLLDVVFMPYTLCATFLCSGDSMSFICTKK